MGECQVRQKTFPKPQLINYMVAKAATGLLEQGGFIHVASEPCCAIVS